MLLIMVQSWESTLPQTGELACPYAKYIKIFKIIQNLGNDAEELDLSERYCCCQDVVSKMFKFPLEVSSPVLRALIFWQSTFILATWNFNLRAHCRVTSLTFMFFLLSLLISFCILILCALNWLFSYWITWFSTLYSLISFFNFLFHFFSCLNISSLSWVSSFSLS